MNQLKRFRVLILCTDVIELQIVQGNAAFIIALRE
jgi:hypothetical protein